MHLHRYLILDTKLRFFKMQQLFWVQILKQIYFKKKKMKNKFQA